MACGTAYYSSVVCKIVIERLVKISMEIDVASEFRYKDTIITNKTLMIVVSQSG